MFDPAMIGKAMALVSRVRGLTHTDCKTDGGKLEALAELSARVETPGVEVSKVALELDGKPVLALIVGPSGTRSALGL